MTQTVSCHQDARRRDAPAPVHQPEPDREEHECRQLGGRHGQPIHAGEEQLVADPGTQRTGLAYERRRKHEHANEDGEQHAEPLNERPRDDGGEQNDGQHEQGHLVLQQHRVEQCLRHRETEAQVRDEGCQWRGVDRQHTSTSRSFAPISSRLPHRPAQPVVREARWRIQLEHRHDQHDERHQDHRHAVRRPLRHQVQALDERVGQEKQGGERHDGRQAQYILLEDGPQDPEVHCFRFRLRCCMSALAIARNGMASVSIFTAPKCCASCW